MITDKKARESALKLQSYCNNHECEKCMFYKSDCLIHKPRIWNIPDGGIVVKLTELELDSLISATAYKYTDLSLKLQGVKDELP